MSGIDVSAVICGIFMSATMKAAVRLGQNDQENLSTTKKTDFDKMKQLFDITRKSILDLEQELHGISAIDWDTIPWVRSTQVVNSNSVRLLKISEAELLSTRDQ